MLLRGADYAYQGTQCSKEQHSRENLYASKVCITVPIYFQIQRSFQELPEASYLSLRDSLMNQLSLSWSPVILTQLGLAAVDLALLMAPWQTPITDIISRSVRSGTVDRCVYDRRHRSREFRFPRATTYRAHSEHSLAEEQAVIFFPNKRCLCCQKRF